MLTQFLALYFEWKIILIFSGLLGLIWSLFLLTHKRGNRTANKFLSLLIVALSVLILRHLTPTDNPSGFYYFLYFISQGVVFLVGPSVYFHIESIARKEISSNRIFTHFIPALGSILFMSVLFFNQEKMLSIENVTLIKAIIFTFVTFQVLHLVVYLYLSRRLVSTLENKKTKYVSHTSRLNLNWVRQLYRVVLFFAFIIIAMYLLIASGGYYAINNSADFLFLFVISIIILRIIFHFWKHPEIVSGIHEVDEKYKTSPVSDLELKELKIKLEQLMMTDRLYRRLELSLTELAAKMDIQPYLLSQLINQEYNQNFFNYINDHRIEYAKQKIRDGKLKTLTLDGLAIESGFNSKSTFNRAFKKKTGVTPKDYSKTHSNS